MASSVEVWLWLLLVMKPANKATAYILSECGGNALQAARNIRDGKYDFLSDAELRNVQSVRTKEVRAVMDLCAKHNIRIITMDSEDYPALLRGIENPPIVLFCAGELGWLNDTVSLAVVGARDVSDYGVRAAHALVEPLAKMGTGIISGLAVGTDAEAHKACIAAGGRTVGVLGCGVLVNYPAANAQLKRDIIRNGGAVISELLPLTKPHPAHFPVRNRIISGLAMGTLVVEASANSGSLLTAKHTLEQERELFCLPPHDITNLHYMGVAPLLREGATPVYAYTDIAMSFLEYFKDKQRVLDYIKGAEKTAAERKPPKRRKTSAAAPVNEKSGTDEEPKAPKPVLTEETLNAVEPKQRELLTLISEDVTKVDDLADKSGLEYAEIIDMLTAMELDGLISRGQDGSYALS